MHSSLSWGSNTTLKTVSCIQRWFKLAAQTFKVTTTVSVCGWESLRDQMLIAAFKSENTDRQLHAVVKADMSHLTEQISTCITEVLQWPSNLVDTILLKHKWSHEVNTVKSCDYVQLLTLYNMLCVCFSEWFQDVIFMNTPSFLTSYVYILHM